MTGAKTTADTAAERGTGRGAAHGAESEVRTGVPRDVLRPAVEFYLDLHAHPELSGAERRTAAALAARLEEAGCTVTRGVGGHGVVGVLRNGAGPTVLLRAELDALPLQERTGLPYASTVPGAMHACGHDLHLAALAGAAAELARTPELWRGTVLFVGQPAEETLTGAGAMLEDGLYERFGVPGVVLAQHTAPLPAGTVAHGPAPSHGPVLAGSVTLEVVVHGRGGHAGAPHLTVDPVIAAAALVLRLQTVVSRETAPADQVVLTVGSLHAGPRGRANVVPELAELSVSVRAASQAALTRAAQAVERIARAECAASGAGEPELTVTSRSPVLVPDAGTAAAVRRAHEGLFGVERVAYWPGGSATEDFALFGAAGAELHGAKEVRSAYWMLGVTGAKQWRAALVRSGPDHPPEVPANHSPGFAPDVRTALPTGIAAMTGAVSHVAREAADEW